MQKKTHCLAKWPGQYIFQKLNNIVLTKLCRIDSNNFSGNSALLKAQSYYKRLSLLSENPVSATRVGNRPFSVPLVACVSTRQSMEPSEEFQRCDYVHVAMTSVHKADKSWREAQVYQHRRRVAHAVLYFGRNEYRGLESDPVIMRITMPRKKSSKSLCAGRASLFGSDGDLITTRKWRWIGEPLVFVASEFVHVADVETQEADSSWSKVEVHQSRTRPEDAVLRHGRWEYDGLDRPLSLVTTGNGALLKNGVSVKTRAWEWVSKPAKPARKITVGTQVQAHRNSNKSSHPGWHDAVVTKIHGGNAYTVRYTDNTVGKRLLRKHIKLLPASTHKANTKAQRRQVVTQKQPSETTAPRKRKRAEVAARPSRRAKTEVPVPIVDKPEVPVPTVDPLSNRWHIAEATGDCLKFSDDNHTISKAGNLFAHNVFAEKGYREGIHYWQVSWQTLADTFTQSRIFGLHCKQHRSSANTRHRRQPSPQWSVSASQPHKVRVEIHSYIWMLFFFAMCSGRGQA